MATPVGIVQPSDQPNSVTDPHGYGRYLFAFALNGGLPRSKEGFRATAWKQATVTIEVVGDTS